MENVKNKIKKIKKIKNQEDNIIVSRHTNVLR